MNESIAQVSLKFTGLFESELLVELLLRHFLHPLADDEEFRQQLLNSAAEVLLASIRGERLLDSVSPNNMNLVAAIFTAESTALDNFEYLASEEVVQRRNWLETLRKSIPSCFCDPEMLS